MEKKRADRVNQINGPKPLKQRTKANIVNDFDLLHIPPGIDLNCIMKECVIPRMPNGYTVKVEEKLNDRKSSILKLFDLRKDGNDNDFLLFYQINIYMYINQCHSQINDQNQPATQRQITYEMCYAQQIRHDRCIRKSN